MTQSQDRFKTRKQSDFISKGPTHPLQWPPGWPRTSPVDRWMPRDHTSTYSSCRDYVLNELRALRAYHVLISSHVPLNSDGEPFLQFQDKKLDDPGVAVYFFLDGRPYVLACDSWEYPKDNLRSVGIALGHMRAAARNVAPIYLSKLLSAFKLEEEAEQTYPRAPIIDLEPKNKPAPPPMTESTKLTQPDFLEGLPIEGPWWEILGLSENASLIEVEAVFRSLARKTHPDQGGNVERMKAINQAVSEARQFLKNKRRK